MKKKKRVIILLAVISVILIGVGSLLYMNRNAVKMKLLQFEYEINKNNYVKLLEKNRDDLEYVAETMKQWPAGVIFFGDSGKKYADVIYINESFSCKNREIVTELSNDQEFYDHLMALYQLDAFDSIRIYQNSISFDFSNPPEGFHSGLEYYKGSTKDYANMYIKDYSYTCILDEHWAVDLIPMR